MHHSKPYMNVKFTYLQFLFFYFGKSQVFIIHLIQKPWHWPSIYISRSIDGIVQSMGLDDDDEDDDIDHDEDEVQTICT